MKFTYMPSGADPQEWDYRADRLMNVEAEEIERVTGMRFAAFNTALLEQSSRAIHALLYIMLKRTIPTVKYDEVQFAMGEVELDFTRAEKVEIRDGFRRRLAEGGLSTEDVETIEGLLVELDREIGAEVDPEPADSAEAEVDGDPKASLEPPSESSGGLHSLPA